jgi:hypothetical protein
MVTASTIRAGLGMGVCILAAACGSELTGPTMAPPQAGPPSGPITVAFSGTVVERKGEAKTPTAGVLVTWCDQTGCSGEVAVTDHDGRYAITAVNATGAVRVQAEREGFLTAASVWATESGTRTASLELWPTENGVFGVVSEAGVAGPTPVAGAIVTSCDGWWECGSSATTGPDGRFRFDFDGWSGPQELHVEKAGFETRKLALTVVGVIEVNVELTRRTDAAGSSGSR